MSGGSFAFLVLFLAVAALVVYLGHLAAKKRREAMTAYAESRGWTYVPDDPGLAHRFAGAPFGVGHGRRAHNVLLGNYDGRPMVAFDYLYKTTSGTGKDRRTQTHHYSVVSVNLGASVPGLQVNPQGLLSGFVGRITNTDIELESEDFNRAFVVTCDDRKFASDVLHPRMMELVQQWPDMGWRFDRDSLLAVRSGKHEPADIDEKLRRLDAILDAVPEFVWREVRGQ